MQVARVFEPTRRPSKDESSKLSNDQAIRARAAEMAEKAKKAAEKAQKAEEARIRARAAVMAEKAKKVAEKAKRAEEPMKWTQKTEEGPHEELRRERGWAAWAKSCPSKKDSSSKKDFSDIASIGSCTTAVSESDLSLRKSIIVKMCLAEKSEKDLRKKLRTLYEIRLAEQTIAVAEKQGKKTHPNLIAKVGRKNALAADPLVQQFRRAGGKI